MCCHVCSQSFLLRQTSWVEEMKSSSCQNTARHKDNVGTHQCSYSAAASAFLFSFSLSTFYFCVLSCLLCMSMCRWREARIQFQTFFLMCDPLCGSRQGLSLIWNSSVRLGCLAIKAQEHSHLCLPCSRIPSMPSCPTFSHVFWDQTQVLMLLQQTHYWLAYLSNPIFVTMTRLQLGCALSKTAVIGSAIVVLVQGFPCKILFFFKKKYEPCKTI